jgi:selenoprotein W-related protein
VAELLQQFEPEIETITLVPSSGGRFEVNVNGSLLYSKQKTGRFAEKGEVARLLKQVLMNPHKG